jgi:HD-like signal output (HDOD) protein
MNAQVLNVLFVDDEQRILDGLRRQLRSHREAWNMRFANSGDIALAMLKEQDADIVVSDMRMPGLTGAQLLMRVRELYPQTTRIILSGQTDQADLLSEIGCIHQYLQKPCEGEALCGTIERTRSLAQKLDRPTLRLAASRVAALPPRPKTYTALVEELTKEEANLSKVSELVSQDPAITAKLMQLVNSAFFGMPRKVNSPHDAVVLLGLKTIHGIVVAGRIFAFASEGAPDQAVISRIWDASVSIGERAAKFAKANCVSEPIVAKARLAGLLSLIGRVILLSATPVEYARVTQLSQRDPRLLADSEKEIYGVAQEEVAAYALGLWAFCDELIEAVAFQNRPSLLPTSSTNDLLGYLHLATANPTTADANGSTLDTDFLLRGGLSNLIPNELRVAA